MNDVNFPLLEQGTSSSVACNNREDEYLVVWQSVNADESLDNEILVLRRRDHDNALNDHPDDVCPLLLTQLSDDAFHSTPSVAVGYRLPFPENSLEHFMVGWVSQLLSPSLQAPSQRKLDARHFEFDPFLLPISEPFRPGNPGFQDLPILPASGNLDIGPSCGVSTVSDAVGLSNSLRPADADKGLIFELGASTSTVDRVRCCDDSNVCVTESCAVQFAIWQPSLAMQNSGSGRYCIAWAEKENVGLVVPRFNIAIQVFDETGQVVSRIDREASDGRLSVNQPERELSLSNQVSPAVDFDTCGNIIVTWVGPSPPGASQPFNVYARRLYFDAGSNQLSFLGNQFVVNTEDGWELGNDPALIHPAVALSPAGLGRFFIAWNANTSAVDQGESSLFPTYFQWGVRGQFFDTTFKSVGPNIDITPNPRPGEPDTFEGVDRTLAESAQHTIDYAIKTTKVATWTETTQVENDEDPVFVDVWVTEFDFP
ncbi:MAG TPA: hypothetical protein VNT79_11940, partial [Phycisphaerae bacterium]|nr:hypothetical protein [Phycisphaerae bacterium]